MKNFFLVLFLMLGFNLSAEVVSLEKVKSFGIYNPDIFVNSKLGIDKNSIVDDVYKALEANFPEYTILRDYRTTEEKAAEVTDTAKPKVEEADCMVKVEIVSVGTTYPVAYSVRIDLYKGFETHSTTVGFCGDNRYYEEVTAAIVVGVKNASVQFYKAKNPDKK